MLANNFLCRVNHTIVGFFARTRLKGDRSPTLAGIAVNACLSFAAIILNCLNRMAPVPRDAVRIHDCNVASIFSLLASSSHIVFAFPLNSNPSIVLRSAYLPSSFSSFFREIGSLSSSLSSGNTSCIPSKIAFARDVGFIVSLE